MKTALLLTTAGDVKQRFHRLLGNRLDFIPVTPPPDGSREKFDALFETWMRLADLIILDGVNLGANCRWAIESLVDANTEAQPVICLVAPAQRPTLVIPRQWYTVISTDADDQIAQSLTTFLELCEARRQQARSAALPAGSAPGSTGSDGPGVDPYRYRDALKTLSGLLGQKRTERELVLEFLRLIRELLGVGKLAVFTRHFDEGMFAGQSTVAGQQLTIAGSVGVASHVAEHLRLTLDGGMAAWLSREVRILRRLQSGDDVRIVREFDLLGTEIAVPMFDNDQLAGVLTFSGKLTGGAITNEELELVYHLLSQLAQALRSLRLAERITAHQRLFADVLAKVHNGVLVVDEDEQILALNDYARQLLGIPTGEALLGRSLDHIPGRVGDVVFEALRVGGTVTEQEVVLPRTSRPLRVHVTRFEQAETGRAMVVALIEDLTQRKLDEARLRESTDREFLMRLAFRLSHELKNSLVSIKIFAQLLPERYSEKDFRDQFSSVVTNEVNRVDVLVNNLTFFSHPLALVHDDLLLTELLEACLKNVTTEFGRKHQVLLLNVGERAPEGATLPVVQIKRAFAHKLSRLAGDKLRLTQAIEHILRNALQSMPAGGRLSISTSDAAPGDLGTPGLPAGGAVKIEIFDSGEGIALENLPRVTEPFFTTRNVGVGLGLTIVKKIIQRHGGRLEIDSLLGRGTTVGLVLPVKPQAHPEDALLREAEPRTGAADEVGEPSAGSRRIANVVRREPEQRG